MKKLTGLLKIDKSAQGMLNIICSNKLITATLILRTRQIALQQDDGPSVMHKNRQVLNTLRNIFSATSYLEELEIERYRDEDNSIINTSQTSARKKTNSANTSSPKTSSMASNTEIKTFPSANSLKRPRKNEPKELKRNTIQKFIGKKKKYKNMSETEILKDYYLNHCGLCRIKFKVLDENLTLGMVQNA